MVFGVVFALLKINSGLTKAGIGLMPRPLTIYFLTNLPLGIPHDNSSLQEERVYNPKPHIGPGTHQNHNCVHDT
jgi:hypothetical protein